MTSRDVSGTGGAVDRIPPHSEPGDVIIGDPDDIDDLVIKLRAYAGAFHDGIEKLKVLSKMDWTGAGATSFQDAVWYLPRHLKSAHTHFLSAAGALDDYADKLRSVHKRCKTLIKDADEARALSRRHGAKVDDYEAAKERKDAKLPVKPPADDPGAAALDACYRRLDKLEEELDEVVRAAKRKLEKVAEKAPDKPPEAKGWDAGAKEARGYVGGLRESLQGWRKEIEFMVEDGFGGANMQLAGMADGAAYAAAHPKEFAKAVTHWDEWQRNPSRTAGLLTPDLVLALATGGIGTLRRGTSAAASAARRLSSRERALRRGGHGRERADGEPEKNDKPNNERNATGEPIDAVTGEMIMSATDVSLPAALPLDLKRHYVSGHPCGGWFGPTWAATLDQRLELDNEGIVYIADDGMVLTYPVPEPDVPVLPSSGPRWPLCWDGKPDGTMSITAAEHNRTLHFAPLPAGGPELILQAVTDRTGEGDRITFTYDEHGTPTEISHSGGYRIAVDTDPEMLRITALRLLHGNQHEHSTTLVRYAYNTAGDLTAVVNSTGDPLRYTYDDEHRVTSWTDRNGTSYGYVYDHRGRVLRGIGPDGILSGRMRYDPATRTNTYTDSLGHTTTYVYNNAYKLISETDPLGNTTRTEWDDTHRHPLTVTDPLGGTTRCTYDTNGHLTAVQRPDGTVAEALYDAWGLPLEVREPTGAVWRHTYDARGNRTSTTDPTGAETHYAYDAAGHLASVTDALGHTTSITTNAAGLPVTVTDPLDHTTQVRRGPHGRITALTDPLGHTTRHGWTIEGRPAWREHPDGTRETWEWDGEGNLVTHTDEAGNTTTHTHTHFDLPATRTDPDGAHYAFTYDTELRLTTVTNPQGREWHYEYDPAGRLVAETDFNGANRTYEVDAAGQLTARTNALGETLRYAYDTVGRLVEQRDEATGEQTTYAYDATGDLLRTTNAAAEVALERDLLGRVVSETVNGRTTTFGYDALGNRTSRRTPSGLTSTWTYDAAASPSALTSGDGTLTFTRDAAGRETARHIGDGAGAGASLAQHWDSSDRLTTQSLRSPADELLQHRTYTYRPGGYVTEIRELTTGTRHFALDPVGRVTGVQAHGWSETYAYDAAGNQTEAEAPAHPATGSRTHDGTLIRRAGRTTYEHDAAGRLTRKTRKLLNGQTRTWTYTWNAEDHLTGATTPRGEEWTYAYDPLGRRISKASTTGARLLFTWDGTRLAEQTTSDGEVTTWDYAPDTHTPLTQTHHAAPSALAAATPPRFHAIVTDLIGTPTELVTPDGEISWQHRTTLWGTPLPAPPGSQDCPLRFPGQYADPETGLHYNYFRYYDPETTHYLTPDPLGLTPAPNHHGYVPNPHTWADALGLEGCGPGESAGPDGPQAHDPDVESVRRQVDPDSLKMTRTVERHFVDLTKHGQPARPFMNSAVLVREIMAGSSPVADPRGTAGAIRWNTPGANNGRPGTWELVVDSNNRIVHFNFTRGGT